MSRFYPSRRRLATPPASPDSANEANDLNHSVATCFVSRSSGTFVPSTSKVGRGISTSRGIRGVCGFWVSIYTINLSLGTGKDRPSHVLSFPIITFQTLIIMVGLEQGPPSFERILPIAFPDLARPIRRGTRSRFLQLTRLTPLPFPLGTPREKVPFLKRFNLCDDWSLSTCTLLGNRKRYITMYRMLSSDKFVRQLVSLMH
ncbi:hypothetical protein AB1N83_001941 [Pleurotus pulmonarius]